MKSLLDNPQRQSLAGFFSSEGRQGDEPHALGPPRWDWSSVRRVLVVRLRSIGDAVLATPTLYALRRFLPHARVDVLLEDWVAPLFDGTSLADTVITMGRDNASKFRVVHRLRDASYDVAYNLHGGTTAAFLTRASGATHRVGYATYRYSSLNNHLAPSPLLLWGSEKTHSVEQQLALPGWTGVPVSDRPRTFLEVSQKAELSVSNRLEAAGIGDGEEFVLVHPAAAFATKQWHAGNFAKVIDYLAHKHISAVAIAGPSEKPVLTEVKNLASSSILALSDLSLQEVAALSKRARVFVGNDSGIAHIAAAVGAPSVVVFGSSNVTHWRPWATAPAEIVRENMPCQPCPGYSCAEFEQPECIRRVGIPSVISALDRVLEQSSHIRTECHN